MLDDLDTATRLPVALAACQAAFEAAGTARPLLEPAARHLVARAARAARTAWADNSLRLEVAARSFFALASLDALDADHV